MAESQVFQLERMYFGSLVDNAGRVASKTGLIARTVNVTRAQVIDCLRLAQLRPPRPSEITHDMPGALGLFRGRANTSILVKAQHNDAGHPQILYILVPPAPLHALGGNVLAFRSLALMEMPSFMASKADLRPFGFRIPPPPSEDEQIDLMLDLLWYCQDSFRIVEGVLAGLIQGWPLVIVNSPPSTDHRLRFVQGLLTMLPIPARVGITFATHVHNPESTPVQIKFTSQYAAPPQHLVFDWAEGQLITPPPEDSYSRYILSQLRLDPALVIEQTAELSRTAVWRARHRENLGRALGWVSRRAAIDRAVLEGQPADRNTVAAILREDPTLSDELRQAYIRHLLAFALALDEPESTDIVPVVAATSRETARAVAHQLAAAVDDHQSWIVYSLVERWLLNVPEASDLGWHAILHYAAKKHLSEVLSQNEVEQAIDFIAYIQASHSVLRLHEAMPDMVRIAQHAAYAHPRLAQVLFLIAVESLHAGELHRLLSNGRFVRQLPQATQMALAYLQPEPRHPAPPHALDTGARAFGEGYRMLVLARLVEWAMLLQRSELVDTTALQSLLIMAQSPQAEQYRTLIRHIVDDFSQVSIIQVLAPPGPRVLVQLLLQTHEYDRAVAQLEFYQNVVFGPERLAEFTQLAGEVFLMTPLATEDLIEALQYMEGSQIRSEPRAAIFCGALINREWAEDQEYTARRLTSMVFGDFQLIREIGQDNALRLLYFHTHLQNHLDALRVGAALVDHALGMGRDGAVLITRMWSLINWDAEIGETAFELLRRYIRGVPLSDVPVLLDYFEGELGPEIGAMLWVTYLLRQVMNQTDLLRFADSVRVATQLLIDIATVYHSDKDLPPVHRLRRDLDTMTGGLSQPERQQIAENTFNVARQVYELGREATRRRGQDQISASLVQGQVVPENGLDLLRFIGGHFAERNAIPLRLEREAMAHIFGNRSAAMFLRETMAIARLLHGLQVAYRSQISDHLTPRVLLAELESLWGTLSLYHQRRIQQQFAQDCQNLADVVSVIAAHGSGRVLSSGGLGRQLETGRRQPRTALETLRWISGYFARRHIRTTRT